MLNMMCVDLISNQKFWVSIKKSIRKSKINPQVIGFINDKRRIVIYRAWLEELLRNNLDSSHKVQITGCN